MSDNLNGIYTALATPFDASEELNAGAMTQLVEDQISAGVAGLVVNGSTGEFPAMDPAERMASVETVAECAQGRADVVVGVGAMRTAEAQKYAEHALSVGARCGLLVMPYYEALTAHEIERFVREVAEVGLPLMLYNNPAGTGDSMDPAMIVKLSEIDGVESVKDTTHNPARLFELDRLSKGRLDVMSGQDTSTIFAFLTGRKAAVWGAGNAHPKGCVELWRLAAKERNLEGSLRLWDALYPLNAFLENHNYVAAVKAAATLRGLDVGKPRRPIQALEGEDLVELKELLAAVDEAVGD